MLLLIFGNNSLIICLRAVLKLAHNKQALQPSYSRNVVGRYSLYSCRNCFFLSIDPQ